MAKQNFSKVGKCNHCSDTRYRLGNRDLVTADDPDDGNFSHFLEKQVPKEVQGTRLDRWLAEWPELTSRAEAQRLLSQKRVHLEDLLISSGARKLQEGQKVQVWLPPPIDSDLEPEEGPLEILFEDEHLLVLNKPAGLVVHPAPGNYTGTLVQRLLNHCKDLSGIGGVLRPGIVHRLDKDTSGTLVVAKHDQAHQRLARQFRKHSIHRRYSALIWGNLVTLQGTIEAPIGRHPRDRKMMAIAENGRTATTYWMQVTKWHGLSHIHCELETGRTHQIRVHFSSQGHPLVGDPLYGKLGKTKHMPQEVVVALQSFPRQALHAAELGFEHPITKEAIEFSAAEPKDFQELLNLLSEKLPLLT
jgi:23S rRNA pseudouridine1911/1915/1917 synthase